MLIIIDNYDSFTYNLVHYLGELGAESTVFRNDAISPEEVMNKNSSGIVISPGPCDPDRAGICLELVKTAAGKIPILGVCLGHQTIGQAFGAKVVPAPKLMHGKLSAIHHKEKGLFKGLPNDFLATRYHSLMVEKDGLPSEIEIIAETSDGIIMGLQHQEYKIFGLQFHPESIESEFGYSILANFLRTTNINVNEHFLNNLKK